MLQRRPIESALISVYNKDGLAPLVHKLHEIGAVIYSTGGTASFIAQQGIPVILIENITEFPEILGGRVKTLHPKVFGGILNRRENVLDQATIDQYQIPNIDLVVVDLYPFEETVRTTDNEQDILEKIDIGGVSLLRAAAKNFQDVAVISSANQYTELVDTLSSLGGFTLLTDRKRWAGVAFAKTQSYDLAIQQYFQGVSDQPTSLRYGENPHQKAKFSGDLTELFEQLNGKELSYNNLLDIDAAWRLMKDFPSDQPFFAIIKHNNACGLALANTLEQAYEWALASDPVSAFGGVLITNQPLNINVAALLQPLFFEVLMAPDFQQDALNLLKEKANRILLRIKPFDWPTSQFRTILNGVLTQDADHIIIGKEHLNLTTTRPLTAQETDDLIMSNIIAKHTKSNAIALVKDGRLLACGTGQTSRVDALQQAVDKAKRFGLDLQGAVMASDAFFPFPDCVEIAAKEGITAIIQPGGSIKDQLSIDACNRLNVSMVFTGHRHFKH
jgi:phosphoribosylaminoimidazolecarboxamide formyltransferase/IMP cyclohydrolase